MVNLNPEQKIWWATLQDLIKKHNIDISNLNALQAIIRQLALEVIRQLPEQDKIILFTAGDKKGQILESFPNSRFRTKEDFISYHEKNHAWGEDSVLLPILNALGYQPFMHLAGTELPAYLHFVQKTNTHLRIDIINYGAVYGGFHWELKGHSNSGNGNCMYYAIAQQIQKDLSKVQPQLEDVKPLSEFATPATAIPAQITKANSFTSVQILTAQSTLFAAPVKAENHYLREAEVAFAKYKVEDEKRYDAAKIILTKFDTGALITAYHYAIEYLVGNDTYLKNRPLHSAEEYDNFIMLNAITTGEWAKQDEDFLRKELIHALAREAWRNPDAYKALAGYQSKPNTTLISSCNAENEDKAITQIMTHALKVC